MACDSVIEARGLAKRYGGVQALADLSLDVRPGQVFGLLGPNGAGKTTSVKLLTGLVHPTSGSGTLLGFRLGDRRARRRLGYLPELFRYQEWLSAREVLQFHDRLCGTKAGATAITGVLDLVDLSARADDRVGSYSKGMQQRLGLAVALLGDPELVILDEPTSALDPAGRLEVREILRGLRARGAAVLLNSHLLTEVELVCDRIAVMARGRVVAQGTISEIVGAGHGVRIRARANGTPLQPQLAAFGRVASDGDTLLLPDLEMQSVPHVVAALVGAGAEIFAVEPLSVTLEQRFLELTREGGA